MQHRTMLSAPAFRISSGVSKRKPVLFFLALGALPLWAIGSFAGASTASGPVVSTARASDAAAERRIRYSIEEIGPLSGDKESRAVAVNEKGQVLGTSSGETGRAFLWERKHVREICPGLPGYPIIVPMALNNRGQVVGSVESTRKDYRFRRAFLWELEHPVLRDLGTPSGEISTAYSINDKGQVIGGSYAGELRPGKGFFISSGQAFMWSKEQGFQYLQAPFIYSDPLNAINNAGQITGASWSLGTTAYRQETASLAYDQIPDTDGAMPSRAFIYEENAGKMCTQPLAIPQAWDSEGLAINRQGDVLVRANLYSHSRRGNLTDPRFYLWRKGTMTALGPAKDWAETPAALNDAGEVVGSMIVRQDNKPRRYAALYKDGKQYPLNDLIPPDSGWFLSEAAGINKKGQIVGTGTHNGVKRAFLLNPVR